MIGQVQPSQWSEPAKGSDQLVRLLEIATTNQFFQFNDQLCEKVDGVTMVYPGRLIADVFVCHLENNLTRDGVMKM